jgi:hypothetical protein
MMNITDAFWRPRKRTDRGSIIQRQSYDEIPPRVVSPHE